MKTPSNNIDTRYTGEILKHLEKQNELLMDAYRSMVEEEMMMRKFYELMSTQGQTIKDEDADKVLNNDGENVHSGGGQ
ncbi:uncharacterized protein LOC131150665 isoform X2 [Malania oleifera]|uniref:uncharacterized protein LOC131150665 isoform X2 n=1 Tax=Malania oleifera TaxID=397392 RepID=UPI0025AE902E|nr:uncharacterized protein LOC131150665 isoform X2 [Malania oleifera]